MDGYQFFLSLVEALIWPLTIVVVARMAFWYANDDD